MRTQLGPDDVATAVLAELFAQMAAKPAFHELRTRQRLGYSVHLSASSLQRQLGLTLRVQVRQPARLFACLLLALGLSCLSCCLHRLGSLSPAAVVRAESMHTDRPEHASVLTVCCRMLCVDICWWLWCDCSPRPRGLTPSPLL